MLSKTAVKWSWFFSPPFSFCFVVLSSVVTVRRICFVLAKLTPVSSQCVGGERCSIKAKLLIEIARGVICPESCGYNLTARCHRRSEWWLHSDWQWLWTSMNCPSPDMCCRTHIMTRKLPGKTHTNVFCAPDEVRTSGLGISSPTLYQLSHPVTSLTCQRRSVNNTILESMKTNKKTAKGCSPLCCMSAVEQ